MNLKFVALLKITPVPAGQYAVVSGPIPDPANMYDKAGCIKRTLWKERRIFKRKINADKYKARLTQRGWADFLEQNSLLNLN